VLFHAVWVRKCACSVGALVRRAKRTTESRRWLKVTAKVKRIYLGD